MEKWPANLREWEAALIFRGLRPPLIAEKCAPRAIEYPAKPPGCVFRDQRKKKRNLALIGEDSRAGIVADSPAVKPNQEPGTTLKPLLKRHTYSTGLLALRNLRFSAAATAVF